MVVATPILPQSRRVCKQELTPEKKFLHFFAIRRVFVYNERDVLSPEGGVHMKTGLVLEGGGMRGIAVVSAIFAAADIRAAAEELLALSREITAP